MADDAAQTDDTARPGDVRTVCKRGQWVTEVLGSNEASRSFADRDEAVRYGDAEAALRGVAHIVIDSPATGAITDPSPEQGEDL